MMASYDLGDEHFCSINKREFPNQLGNYQICTEGSHNGLMLQHSVNHTILIIEIISHPVQQI
jgi:hypothetical protein